MYLYDYRGQSVGFKPRIGIIEILLAFKHLGLIQRGYLSKTASPDHLPQ
jgi:hypothetical protein